MLSFLNVLFFVAHNVLIAFNLVGWIWPRTRKLHLVTGAQQEDVVVSRLDEGVFAND